MVSGRAGDLRRRRVVGIGVVCTCSRFFVASFMANLKFPLLLV